MDEAESGRISDCPECRKAIDEAASTGADGVPLWEFECAPGTLVSAFTSPTFAESPSHLSPSTPVRSTRAAGRHGRVLG